MDSAKIDELERLAAQATPGPWYTLSEMCEGVGCDTIISKQGEICDFVGNMHNPYGDRSYIVAARNAVPELIAENRALQERVRELERQRDWLIRYAWIDTNAPCPYEMGHFDQKKICPCWTPYHDWENAEDMSRDDWHDLLMEGVMTEEDKVNCATDFCECLLVAAEQAAKEAENG